MDYIPLQWYDIDEIINMVSNEEPVLSDIYQQGQYFQIEHFEPILRKHLADETIVIQTYGQVIVTENILANVYRINLYGERTSDNEQVDFTYSFIFKGKNWKPLAEGSGDENFLIRQYAENELVAYKTVLSALQEYFIRNINSMAYGPLEVFRLPEIAQMDDTVIFMEDFHVSGYEDCYNDPSLSHDTISAALKELAKLHYTSLELKIEDVTTLDKLAYNFTYLDNMYQFQARHFKKAVKYFNKLIMRKDAVGLIPEQIENIETIKIKLENLLISYPMEIKRLLETPSKGTFRALCHGNTATRHMLVKKEQKDTSVAWIDYRQMQFTSVAVDLSPFLYTALTPRRRVLETDYWLDFYFTELDLLLRQCREGINRIELQQEYLLYKIYGFAMLLWQLRSLYKREVRLNVDDDAVSLSNKYELAVMDACVDYIVHL